MSTMTEETPDTVAGQDAMSRRTLYTGRAARWMVRHPAVFPFVLLVLIALVVGTLNPFFWQLANLFDILRAAVVPGLLALGVLVVLAAGGLDVSFTAIAALVMYPVAVFVSGSAPDLGIAPILLMGAVAGGLFGTINGILVNVLKAPALIITIGTQYAFRGLLLTFVGTALFTNIPASMTRFGQLALFRGTTQSGLNVALPAFVLVFFAAAVMTWLILNRTLIGRAIYAVGGSRDIAARLGYSVARVHLFVFAWAGMLAGIAGIMHVTANRLANPFDLGGTELSVIAAVILGGARITGGTGTVLGTVVGTLVITLINNVLILVGVPSNWQTAILGAFILLAGLFYARLDRLAAGR